MGIPSSGDSGHQGTESPLHESLVGIPSSGDSVQWGFRPEGIPGTYRIKSVLCRGIYRYSMYVYMYASLLTSNFNSIIIAASLSQKCAISEIHVHL